mgnify:CR=1 FL=1
MIVLFDFDGVIADTESQYTCFWNKMGKDYLGLDNFGLTIKGQTLVQIFGKYFDGKIQEQEEIVPRLNEFERNMTYGYIPGAYRFLKELKEAGLIQGEVETPKVKYCINRDNWRLAQELFGEFFCECARKKESCCG